VGILDPRLGTRLADQDDSRLRDWVVAVPSAQRRVLIVADEEQEPRERTLRRM